MPRVIQVRYANQELPVPATQSVLQDLLIVSPPFLDISATSFFQSRFSVSRGTTAPRVKRTEDMPPVKAATRWAHLLIRPRVLGRRRGHLHPRRIAKAVYPNTFRQRPRSVVATAHHHLEIWMSAAEAHQHTLTRGQVRQTRQGYRIIRQRSHRACDWAVRFHEFIPPLAKQHEPFDLPVHTSNSSIENGCSPGCNAVEICFGIPVIFVKDSLAVGAEFHESGRTACSTSGRPTNKEHHQPLHHAQVRATHKSIPADKSVRFPLIAFPHGCRPVADAVLGDPILAIIVVPSRDGFEPVISPLHIQGTARSYCRSGCSRSSYNNQVVCVGGLARRARKRGARKRGPEKGSARKRVSSHLTMPLAPSCTARPFTHPCASTSSKAASLWQHTT